jgi:hypothetical protein
VYFNNELNEFKSLPKKSALAVHFHMLGTLILAEVRPRYI